MSVMWVIVYSIHTSSLKWVDLPVPILSLIFLHGVKRPGDLFHLLTFKFVCNVTSYTDNLLDNFGAFATFLPRYG